MATSPNNTVRFCLTYEGRERCLVSAYASSKGEVVIDMKSKGYDHAATSEAEKIIEHRFTIHNSENSQIGATTVNHHKTTEDGRKTLTKLFTLGPKVTKRFQTQRENNTVRRHPKAVHSCLRFLFFLAAMGV